MYFLIWKWMQNNLRETRNTLMLSMICCSCNSLQKPILDVLRKLKIFFAWTFSKCLNYFMYCSKRYKHNIALMFCKRIWNLTCAELILPEEARTAQPLFDLAIVLVCNELLTCTKRSVWIKPSENQIRRLKWKMIREVWILCHLKF